MKSNKKKVFTKNGTLFSPNSGEDQKKRSSPKMKHLFSPNSSEDLRSDAHQSQIIGGDADEDHIQIVGGIQSNYWGDISPIPPGFGTPVKNKSFLSHFIFAAFRLGGAGPPCPPGYAYAG